MDVQCGVSGAQEQEWPQGATVIGQLTRKVSPVPPNLDPPAVNS